MKSDGVLIDCLRSRRRSSEQKTADLVWLSNTIIQNHFMEVTEMNKKTIGGGSLVLFAIIALLVYYFTPEA